jgi:L-alanine-DL-glutamate epimerase-like enolase superfamily enzyme
VRDALTAPSVLSAEGRVAVPEGPGLGITVDRDALRHFAA